MTERPSPGEQLAGIAGLALFLIMFLFAWYSWPGAALTSVNGLDAFDAFSDWIDLILILAAFSGICLGLFGSGVARLPVSLSVVTTVLGGLSALLILVCIISTPSVPTFGAAAAEGDLGVEPGAWLGLIAAILVAVGGYKVMQEEGMTFADAADNLSGPGGGGGEHHHTPPPPPPPQQPPQPHAEPPPPHAAPPPPPQAAPPPPPPPAEPFPPPPPPPTA
jgi:hypothetical protein